MLLLSAKWGEVKFPSKDPITQRKNSSSVCTKVVVCYASGRLLNEYFGAINNCCGIGPFSKQFLLVAKLSYRSVP